jgi:hypothetical protein
MIIVLATRQIDTNQILQVERYEVCTLFLSGPFMWIFEPRIEICIYKRNGKAAPLPTWSGPEGSRSLRFPDFMKTAQDGGKVVSLTHWPPLPTGNTLGTHFC